MATKRVGLRIISSPLGAAPCQRGPTTRKSRAVLRPVVRVPGAANTSVHILSIGNKKKRSVAWLGRKEQLALDPGRGLPLNTEYRRLAGRQPFDAKHSERCRSPLLPPNCEDNGPICHDLFISEAAILVCLASE